MTLTDREITFLVESQRIKFLESAEVKQRRGVLQFQKIPTIDYTRPELQKGDVGYAGAFLQMKKIAQTRQPLELDEICSWQKLIVDEQKEYGMTCLPAARGILRSPKNDFKVSAGNVGHLPAVKVKGTLSMWVAMLNKAAMKCMLASGFYHAINLVEYAAILLHGFEKITPFAAGNGCLARLLFNYFTILMDQPILVFSVDDRVVFKEARTDPKLMQRFIADKVRLEITCRCGQFAPRVQQVQWLDTYRCPECANVQTIPRYALRPFVES